MPIALGIVNDVGRVPLIQFRRNALRGYWGLPGGKFKVGEFLPAAIERELLEELGVPVQFTACVAIVEEDMIDEGVCARLMMYVCTVRLLTPPSFLPVDRPEGRVEWFTSEEIGRRRAELLQTDYEILRDAMPCGGVGAPYGHRIGYYRTQLSRTADELIVDYFHRYGDAGVV